MAHYLKIPPKHTFWAQMIATIISSFVCTGVLNFQMNQIEGVCTTTQKDHYTCPGINQFFTAAVLWGTIGPKKAFGKGGQYSVILVGFPVWSFIAVCGLLCAEEVPEAEMVEADSCCGYDVWGYYLGAL
jgi:hypothetical protein